MGNDNVKYNNANSMMKQTSPNLFEITKQLPNNKEVRIKKIYHVNRPDVEPPPPPPPPSLLVVKQPDPVLVVKKAGNSIFCSEYDNTNCELALLFIACFCLMIFTSKNWQKTYIFGKFYRKYCFFKLH